jgi:hypothetical protein
VVKKGKVKGNWKTLLSCSLERKDRRKENAVVFSLWKGRCEREFKRERQRRETA